MSAPQNNLREFGLTTWSITNRTTVFVITAIVALSGLGAGDPDGTDFGHGVMAGSLTA